MGAIKSMSKLDENNLYTMFMLTNGSIFIFKNSTIISNKQKLDFNLINVIKVNIFERLVYFGLHDKILIMQF